MIENDFDDFQDLWMTTHELSAGNKIPSENAINAVFETLVDYSLESVKKALLLHRKKTQFAPTPHDVIKILHDHSIYSDINHVECPKPDEIIALAKLADTPLGILARIQIGVYDLDNQDSFYLRQRAQEVILRFDDYVARCVAGDYSPHELSTMKKYCVSCTAPLAKGLPKPGHEAANKLLKLSSGVKAAGGPSLRLVQSR